MNAAQKFLSQLQEGNTSEAIKTIEESLKERAASGIDSIRKEILESYGFSEKKKYDEEMDDEDKEKNKDKDDEDDEDEEEEDE